MSRTKKKPYTKSKRFDKTCRNHGKCPVCRANRLIQRTREDERVRQELRQKEMMNSLAVFIH
jgi:hypothetical protein